MKPFSKEILITPPGPAYRLLDSGDGEKLEQYGSVILSRPDPQALWKKRMPESEWEALRHAYFARDAHHATWTVVKGSIARWPIDFGGLKMWIKPTAFKHTGLFPEQLPNWQWMYECITATRATEPERPIEVLNLFGYTGGASLACAQAGAQVVHVDSSKAAITWGRDNAEISGLTQAPIRWILDDARVFVNRELKRGRQYDAIILDPPAFGHGPKKELWKIEEHLLPFIAECQALLKPNALFMIINGYAAGYSSLAYSQNLIPLIASHGGEVHGGELTIEEAPYGAQPGRLLPSGIFARWHKPRAV